MLVAACHAVSWQTAEKAASKCEVALKGTEPQTYSAFALLFFFFPRLELPAPDMQSYF